MKFSYYFSSSVTMLTSIRVGCHFVMSTTDVKGKNYNFNDIRQMVALVLTVYRRQTALLHYVYDEYSRP